MNLKSIIKIFAIICMITAIALISYYGCDHGEVIIPATPTETPTPTDVNSNPQYRLVRVDASHHQLQYLNPTPNEINSIKAEGSEIHPLLDLVELEGTVRENGQGGYILDFEAFPLSVMGITLTFFAEVSIDANSQLSGKCGMSLALALDDMGINLDMLIEVPIEESQSAYPGWLTVADPATGDNIVETHLYMNDENIILDISSLIQLDISLRAYDPKWEDPVRIDVLGKIYPMCFISDTCTVPAGEKAINVTLNAFGNFGFNLGPILDLLTGLLGGGEAGGGGIEDLLGDIDIGALLEGINADNIGLSLHFLDETEISVIGDLNQMDITIEDFQIALTVEIPEGEPLITTDEPLEIDPDPEVADDEIGVYYLEMLIPDGIGIFMGDPISLSLGLDLANGGFSLDGLDTITIYISDAALTSQTELGLSLIASLMGIGLPTNFDGTYNPGTANLRPACEDEEDPCFGNCDPLPADSCYDPNKDDANLAPFSAEGIPIAGLVESYGEFSVDETGTVLPYIEGVYQVTADDEILNLGVYLGVIIPLSTTGDSDIMLPIQLDLPVSLGSLLDGLNLY